MDWKSVELGDLIHVKHGYAFDGDYFGEEGPYIVLTPGNFYEEGGFKSKGDDEKHFTGEVQKEYILSEGDLIVAMTEQAHGLLGSAAFVPEDDLYLHNQRLGLIQIEEGDKLDKRFLYYLFNSYLVRSQISATASGAKVRHTSPSRIYETEVELPPLPIQRRIAGILGAYDDLIANNRRRIELLEAMATAIFREWFVHYRFPGHADVGRRETEIGAMPDVEGWRVEKMGILVNRRMKTIKPYENEEETFTYFSFGAHDEGKLPIEEQGEEINSNKHGVFPDTVLIARLNPRIPRTWRAFPKGSHRAITSTEFLVLEPKPPLTPAFLYELLSSRHFRDRFQSLASGTSTSHQRVSPSDFMGIEVTIPPKERIDRFTEQVDPIHLQVQNLRERNQILRETRDLLLPRLVSGDIEVDAAMASA